MTREERQEVRKMLAAHMETIGVSEACARTTRDLAAEIKRGGAPSKDDLQRTVEEAEAVLAQLERVRQETERLIRHLN
jgi:hypothetical protein